MQNKIKKIIEWTKLKIRLQQKINEGSIFYRQREIWWCSLGVNIGHEQDGKGISFQRPILILKGFNPHLLWVLPISTQVKRGKYYHTTEYKNQTYNIILSQLKLISTKRLLRKIRTMPKDEFKEVKKKIKSFI